MDVEPYREIMILFDVPTPKQKVWLSESPRHKRMRSRAVVHKKKLIRTSNLRVPADPFANVRKGWKQFKQRERSKKLQASKRQTQFLVWFLLPRGGLRVYIYIK